VDVSSREVPTHSQRICEEQSVPIGFNSRGIYIGGVPHVLYSVLSRFSMKIDQPDEDHVWFEDRWMVASLCDE
jgi:hypothetical protein